MLSDNSYITLVKGRQVTFVHQGSSVMPDFKYVTSVSAIPFTESGNIIAVHLRHRGIDLPGGHVEPGELTPGETMNREVMEEACMTIRDAVLTEVIESDYFKHPSYMLLYGAYVDELFDFVPSEEADERVELTRKDFIRQYEAGSKKLMAIAVENAWRELSKN
jgi:8-oxo-dGTP diphosphatase